jgi:long-subunit acyl-CoA synthetase (AMP-forming)
MGAELLMAQPGSASVSFLPAGHSLEAMVSSTLKPAALVIQTYNCCSADMHGNCTRIAAAKNGMGST